MTHDTNLDTNSGSFLPIPFGKIQLPSKSGSRAGAGWLILTTDTRVAPFSLRISRLKILLMFLGVTLRLSRTRNLCDPGIVSSKKDRLFFDLGSVCALRVCRWRRRQNFPAALLYKYEWLQGMEHWSDRSSGDFPYVAPSDPPLFPQIAI